MIFQCCNHVTVFSENISTLKKGELGIWQSRKKMFLQLGKDANRMHLFCSHVLVLLSMIVDLRATRGPFLERPGTFSGP